MKKHEKISIEETYNKVYVLEYRSKYTKTGNEQIIDRHQLLGDGGTLKYMF